MHEPVFRRANEDDLPAILTLLADDEHGRSREVLDRVPDPRYVAAFQAMEADPNQMPIVGAIGERVVAYLQLTVIPGLSRLGATRAQVESVRVARDLRGKGIGRRLMDYAIEEAGRRGCSLMQLTTDKTRPDAKRFYESLGFTASHEGMKRTL
jgi:ribosomal protein S18 acetylase RimI-like enzyme